MYADGDALMRAFALERLQEADAKAHGLVMEEKKSTVQPRQLVGTLPQAWGVMVRPIQDLFALVKVIVAEG